MPTNNHIFRKNENDIFCAAGLKRTFSLKELSKFSFCASRFARAERVKRNVGVRKSNPICPTVRCNLSVSGQRLAQVSCC
jgi:hypothetical protein